MKAHRFGKLTLITATATAIAVLATVTAAWGTPSRSGSADDRIPGHYIVVFKDSVDHPGAVAEAQTESRDGDLGFVYRLGIKGYSASDLSKGDVEALRDNPKVRYVIADREGKFIGQTIPLGISRVFAPQLPALDIDEIDDVRIDADIAMLDSGIDSTHPDLNVAGRTDCTLGTQESCVDGQGSDELGHGTHTAGIAGAIDNGFGTVGVAPGARIWAVRVGQLVPTFSATLAGVQWVTAHAAQIEAVNMSLQVSGDGTLLEEAIEASIQAGVVYVVAAGNDDEEVIGAPAVFDDVITVSAMNDHDGLPGGLEGTECAHGGGSHYGADDTLASYSNWGPAVDITAPGSCILSTVPGGGYGKKTGTSMAAPHVAGAAAILASKSNPEDREDVEAIKEELIEEGSLNWVDDSGDGKKEPLLDLRPPTREAVTNPATDLHPHTAQLNGIANPGGLAATYTFEYGTTTEYGKSTPTTPQSIGSGIGDIEVSRQISTKADVVYHYRLRVTNSEGTSFGEDHELRTSVWDAQATPKPSGAGETELEDISCLTRSECVGVGFTSFAEGSSYVRAPLAEAWDGSKWSNQSTPKPEGGTAPELRAVSCVSASFCMAAGLYKVSNRFRPFAETWDGSKWSVLTMPIPGDIAAKTSMRLDGLSCTSASFCIAAGSYASAVEASGAVSEEKSLVELWDGSKWSIQTSPNPTGQALTRLSAVSCTSASACIAVGNSRTSSSTHDYVTLAELWDGSKWSVSSTPNPAGAEEAALEDVSCISATFCMAVGDMNEKEKFSLANNPVGLTESWDGTKWSLLSSSLPGALSAVSCASTRACWAVGTPGGGGAASIAQSFGLRWDGSEWLTATTSSPEGATQIKRNSVSCSTATSCTMVGGYIAPRFSLEQGRLPMAAAVSGPTATTAVATNVGASEATVAGTVNPKDYDTRYQFEYGKTTSYGQSVPAEAKDIGEGSTDVKVAETAKGLVAGTTYHFRMVASNSETGTVYGSDQTFTTGTVQHWFACTKQAGGKYTNSKCTTEGSLKEYEALKLKEGEKTTITAKGNPLAVTATIGGLKTTFSCETEVLSASLENPSGGGNGAGGAEIKLKGCKAEGTAAEKGCKVTAGTSYPSKLALSMLEGKAMATFSPKEGTNLATFTIASCAGSKSWEGVNGSFQITGSLRGLFSNAESKIEFNAETTAEGLRLNGSIPATGVGSIGLETSGGGYVEALGQPTAKTEAATAIGSAEATLNGTVNPEGADTHYQFEYGKTTSYGQVVPLEAKDIGEGSTDVKVAETAKGLVPSTTYHFRVFATNGVSTTYGNDQTFTTAAPPLRWSACTKQTGGKYTSSKCATEGSPKEWESVLLKEGEKTTITAKGNPLAVTATIGGLKTTFSCETEVLSASLENPSGGGNGAGGAEIKLKGCKAEGTAAEKGCKVTAGTSYPSKLALSTLEGKAMATFTPKEGTNLATFTIASCAGSKSWEGVNGSFQLAGSLRGLYSNAESKIEFNAETTAEGLKLNGSIPATGVGSIGLETSGGGYVRAE